MGNLESRRVGGNSARLGMDSACNVHDHMLYLLIFLNMNKRGATV